MCKWTNKLDSTYIKVPFNADGVMGSQNILGNSSKLRFINNISMQKLSSWKGLVYKQKELAVVGLMLIIPLGSTTISHAGPPSDPNYTL